MFGGEGASSSTFDDRFRSDSVMADSESGTPDMRCTSLPASLSDIIGDMVRPVGMRRDCENRSVSLVEPRFKSEDNPAGETIFATSWRASPRTSPICSSLDFRLRDMLPLEPSHHPVKFSNDERIPDTRRPRPLSESDDLRLLPSSPEDEDGKDNLRVSWSSILMGVPPATLLTRIPSSFMPPSFEPGCIDPSHPADDAVKDIFRKVKEALRPWCAVFAAMARAAWTVEEEAATIDTPLAICFACR
mmetsp:Transcript_13766/g.31877  ORF Transcript_13766/g.31877 Transcript_13766/m.31877 type:complete len:246 (-) Transcript_13766:1976-2713(-)